MLFRRTAEKTEVDLEHSLQETHIRALIQADLVLPTKQVLTQPGDELATEQHSPQVDKQDFRRRQTEQSALPLKILVFSALSSVGSLDIHDDSRRVLGGTHPDTWTGNTSGGEPNVECSKHRGDAPLVVCCLFDSSITSNDVPNRRFKRVPTVVASVSARRLWVYRCLLFPVL